MCNLVYINTYYYYCMTILIVYVVLLYDLIIVNYYIIIIACIIIIIIIIIIINYYYCNYCDILATGQDAYHLSRYLRILAATVHADVMPRAYWPGTSGI